MSDEPPSEFLEPWLVPGADNLAAMEAELAREMRFNPRHPLNSVTARAVARRADCDDVLFEITGHESLLAVVHLTWSQSPETRPACPDTTLFASWAEWTATMKRDHEEWSLA